MKTKLSQLKEYMAAGDWQKALSLASKFPQLGEHKVAITQGHSASVNRSFYLQIGKDPDALVESGIQALIARYTSK